LRCLFIVFIVLMLAEPQFNLIEKKNRLVLVESGLEKDVKYAQLIDSLKAMGFEVRDLWEAGSDNSHTGEDRKPDYWNALRKVAAGGEAVVLSYGYVDGFKGMRVGLPEAVRWLSAEPDSITYNLNIIALPNDSVLIRRGTSRFDKTSFHNVMTAKTTIAPAVIQLPDTISIAIVFDAGFQYDKDILLAALKAFESNGTPQLIIDALPTSTYVAGNHNWTIWLSETSPPETRTNLIFVNEKDGLAQNLFVQTTSGRNQTWMLTERLNEEVALREHLTVRLAMILQSDRKHEDRANVSDRRVLDEKLRWSSFPLKTDDQRPRSDNDSWQYLSIAILLTLSAERLLAFKRDQ
jgi:hypothetical protein